MYLQDTIKIASIASRQCFCKLSKQKYHSLDTQKNSSSPEVFSNFSLIACSFYTAIRPEYSSSPSTELDTRGPTPDFSPQQLEAEHLCCLIAMYQQDNITIISCYMLYDTCHNNTYHSIIISVYFSLKSNLSTIGSRGVLTAISSQIAALNSLTTKMYKYPPDIL